MNSGPTDHDPRLIRALAEAELRDERIRHRIEAEKIRLRSKRWWHRLIPFRITIQKRST